MTLKHRICKYLFKWHGWSLKGDIPPEVFRCIFVFAPHTSNWDFYFGMMCMFGWGIPCKVAIKQFWTQFPFSLVIKPLGGVGINRSKKKDGGKRSQVEMLAEIFDRYEQIALIITPEGSRSKRTQWKSGFYHIAQAAKVPIVTLTGNFSTRTVEFGPVYKNGESLETVMRGMMKFFVRGGAKYPENFALDERYI